MNFSELDKRVAEARKNADPADLEKTGTYTFTNDEAAITAACLSLPSAFKQSPELAVLLLADIVLRVGDNVAFELSNRLIEAQAPKHIIDTVQSYVAEKAAEKERAGSSVN